MLFGAVALTGVLAAVGSQLVSGPITTITRVTQKNMADTQMLMNAKILVSSAVNGANGGDPDNDGTVEPATMRTTTGAKPVNGGLLPSDLGLSLTDPWGSSYGYCVWDHGTTNSSSNRITGVTVTADIVKQPVIAVIAAGPDKTFQTTCSAGGGVSKAAGSDDYIFKYTYAEATSSSNGLWQLNASDAKKAQLVPSLSSTPVAATIDRDTGVADFAGIITSLITAKTNMVSMGGGLKLDSDTVLNPATCVAGTKGMMRLNATTNKIEICDGAGNWGAASGNSLWTEVGTTDATFARSGNVGIGVATPTAKLDIAGGNLRVDTDTLIVDATSHRVAIGSATAPTYKLDVTAASSGDGIRTSGTTNPGITVQVGSGASGNLGVASANAGWSGAASATDTVLRSNTGNLVLTARSSSGDLIFATGSSDTEKMRLSSAGNLGIGAAPGGTNRLDVAGSTGITTDLTVGNNTTITNNLTVDTNTLFVDATNNRVGIGTLTPTAPLTFASGNTNKIEFNLGFGIGTSANNMEIYADKAIQFRDGGYTGSVGSQIATESGQFTYFNAGRVGIGTSAPNALLEVEGGIKMGTDTVCNSSKYGTLRWNLSTVEYCSTTGWRGVSQIDKLDDIGDVDAASPTSGQALIYDGSVWKNRAIVMGDISDGVSPAGSDGSVQFKAGSSLAADAANFHWDDSNNRLGIGMNNPARTLDVSGTFGATGNAVLGGTLTVTGNTTIDTNTLHVDATNNRVGVGTTSPLAPLDVVGSGRFGNSSNGTVLTLQSERPWNFNFSGSGSGTTLNLQPNVDGKGFQIISDNATNTLVQFAPHNTAGSQRIYLVPSGGNVGVGMSTAPQSLLHVASTGYAQFEKTVTTAPDSADCNDVTETGRQVVDTSNRRWYTCLGTSGWAFAKIGTSDYSGSQWLAGIDPGDIYYNAGMVGIGTNDPDQPLDIVINETGYMQLSDSAAAGSAIRIGEGWNSTTGYFAPTVSTYPIGSNMPMVIQSSLRDADDSGNTAGIILRSRKATDGPTVRPVLAVQGITAGGAANPLMTVHGDGKVSIGNVVPTSTLDVLGDLRLRTGVISLTNDGATNSNNDYIVLDDSNNLYFAQNPMAMSLVGDNPRGLSTTAATGSLFARYGYFDRSLRIGDDTANACTGGNFAGLIRYNSGKIQYCNGVAWADMAASGAATAAGTTYGAVQFRSTTDSLAADDLNFFWDNSNKRLGIGTAAPVVPLNVLRNATLGANWGAWTLGNAGLQVAEGANTSTGLYMDGNTILSNMPGSMFIGNTTANSLSIGTNNLERINITSGGAVGVGTTATTGSLLHVGTTGYFQAERSISTGAPVSADCDAANETGRQLVDTANSRWYTCAGTAGWQYTNIGTAGGAANPGGTDKMVQFNDGGTTLAGAALMGWDKTNTRLGVGTLSPTAVIHSQASGAYTSNLRMTNSQGSPASYEFRVYNSQSGYPNNSFELFGGVNGSESSKFVISTSGKLGLGVTNPTNEISFDGNGNRVIAMDRTTTTNTAGFNMTIRAAGATVGATDKAGGDLYLSSGISTGSAGGHLYFQTTSPGTAGTTNNSPTTAMVLTGDNNLGVGLSSPNSVANRITVLGPSNAQSVVSTKSFDAATAVNSGGYLAGRSRSATVGTAAHPQSADRIGYFSAISDNGGTAAYAGMDVIATEAHTNTAKGMMLQFRTSANAGVASAIRMTVNNNGNVGIGSSATVPESLLQVDSSGYAQFSKTFAGAPTTADCDAAAEAGRQTIDTTNGRWYTCLGTAGWQYTSVGAAGGASNAAGTVAGAVQFRGTTGLLAADDVNYVWDNTNKRIGFGTASPATPFHLIDAANSFDYRMGSRALTLTAPSSSGVLPFIEWKFDTTRAAYMGYGATSASKRVDLTLENGYNFQISGGNTGIGTPGTNSLLEVGSSGYAQFSKTFSGAPTAGECAAATVGRQTIDVSNNRFYVCTGAGGWRYTNITTTGVSSAAGADTQIQFNDGGTTLAGATNLTWDKTNKHLTIDTAANGTAAFSQAGAGIELFAREMTTANKYTPFLKFGSSDAQFTTTQPKTLVAIAGEAQDNFTADANGIMDLVFFTGAAGTTPTMTEAFRITSDNRISVGGVGAPTYDLSFGGNNTKAIGMERHSTASTAGNNLTVQAGGAAATGSNLAGGNLLLSSGISTGTNSSNIIFNTPTPTTTGATAVNPTQSMILQGLTNNLGVDVTTPRERLELSKGHLFHTGSNINHYFNTYYDSVGALTKFAGYAGASNYGGQITFAPGTGNLALASTTTAGVENATATFNSTQLVLTPAGRVGIGIAPTGGALQVSGGGDVSLTNTTGNIISGAITGDHIAMDNNEIQARNASAAANLYLNVLGGGVVIGGGNTAYGTLDVRGGVKIADYTTCAAGGANNGVLRFNSSKVQFCLNGTWTDMAASGTPPAVGSDKQMIFNDGGTLQAGATNLLWNKTNKTLSLSSLANGITAFAQTSAGVELLAQEMDLTNKFTPYIKFGSTDANFSSTPKIMAAITGEAQEAYTANANGGMDIVFLTAATGATPAMTEAFRITADNKIAIGGQAVGSTYDIAISNTSAKTIAMERNTTAAGAGQNLTLQAGGVSSTGTITDKSGGTLFLNSGLSTGTGTSNIYFQTPTASGTGSTVNNPVTKMILNSAGNLGIGTAATAPASSLSVAGNGAATYRAYIVGTGTTSSSYGMVIRDSGGATSTFYVRDDGMVYNGSSMGVNGAPGTSESMVVVNASGKGARIGSTANDGTDALLVVANAAAQSAIVARPFATSPTANILDIQNNAGTTSYLKVAAGGQVGVNIATATALNAAFEVNGGIKVGDNSAACAAGGANNGTIRYNTNKIQFCLNGTWTDMAASGASLAGGATTQIQYNLNGALAGTPSFTLDASSKQLTLDTAANGIATFAQTSPGFELFAREMTTVNKYTPFLKFGSSDANFTTSQPKTMAAIAGEAIENYTADGNGGMDMIFFTAGTGVTPSMTEAMRITSDNRIVLGGQTPASTFDIALTNTGTTGKTIGMERNLTSAGAGNSLTVQAGGVATAGSINNKTGGNLILSSGLSTGTAGSSIVFQTATPSVTSGAGVNNPTVSMTLDPSGILTFPGTTTEKIRLYSSAYGFGISSASLDVFSNGYVKFRDGGYAGTVISQISTSASNNSFIGGANVGIGTTTPQTKLEVNGTLNVADGTNAVRGALSFATTTGFRIMNQDNSAMVLGTNNIQRMYVTPGGLVSIGSTGTTVNATLDVFGGVKVADYATCAAGGTNNGTIRFNSSKIQFCLNGTWTDMAASGSSTAGGTNTQVQFNDGGTTLAGAANLTWDKTNKHLTIDTAANGSPVFTTATAVQNLPGYELMARAMTTTNKYTPAIKFGSTSTSFTTTNPKFNAMIMGEAQDNYTADANGAMDLVFFTGVAGTAPVPTEAFRITSDNKIAIGGQAVGSTYDIALSNTAAKTIAMERNTTSGGAGNNLTVQAGGIAASGTITDKVGGTLNLASGIATGTGGSSMTFQTVTPAGTGSTPINPTTKMTLTGAGNLGIGAGVTAPVSALSVGGVGGSSWKAYIQGLGTTSGTYSFVTRDSGGATNTFYVRDDGVAFVNSGLFVNATPTTTEEFAVGTPAGVGARIGNSANDGTAALLVTANAAAQRGIIARPFATSPTGNILDIQNNAGATSYLKVAAGGQVGINIATATALNAALEVNGGIKVGDNAAACAAGGANNGTIRYNTNKIQFCLNGTWTDMAASGSSTAAGADKQLQFNDGGTNQAGATNLLWNKTNKTLSISSLANGAASIVQTTPGLELFAQEMTTANKFTPAIKFGSTDAQFTTTQPKTMATITGEAQENYTADANGGMDIVFHTAATGVTPTLTEAFRITADNKIAIGGQAAGSTYDIAISNTSAKTIAMERNSTASTAGQNLTLQAGGVAASGTLTNLNGGNLVLSSGISTGSGSSSILFNTPTPTGSGVTVITPSTSMTLDGSSRLRVGSAAAPISTESFAVDNVSGRGVRIGPSTASNNGTIGLYVSGAATTQVPLMVRPIASASVNILSIENAAGSAQHLSVSSAGNVGVGANAANSLLEVSSTGYAQFSKTFAGIPTAGDCAAATTGRQTIDLTNGRFYVCTGAGGWKYTSIGTSGGVGAAAGADKQIQYNNAGALAGAVNFTLDSSTKQLTLDTLANGATSFLQNSPGLELFAKEMTTANKFTPFLKFGSTDAQFTTTPQKTMIAIGGEAQDSFTTDANGAMDLVFFTAAAAATPTMSEAFRITSDNKISIGGATAGSTYDIALYNTGTTGKTIAMERNATASGAGNSLTVQAGGAATGTNANKAGGNLVLASGISTGTGSSNILLQTATPGATGSTANTPSTIMTLLGTNKVGIGTAATAPVSLLSVGANGNSTYQAYIRGMGATSATLGLVVQDSAATSTFWVRDDGAVLVGDKLGVGVTPTYNLDVFNGTALGVNAADTSILSQVGQSNGSNTYIRTIQRRHTAGATWTGTNMRMQKVVASTAQGFIDFGIDGVASDAGIGFGSNATTRMVLTAAGNLGIANTSPSYPLDVTGTIRATSVIYTSDARSKVDIRPLTGEEGLELLAELNPVHYKWKDKAADQGLQWGLIAQEVEKVMPSIVTTDVKGMKAVDYRALTPVLIKAVQQLNEKNKQLEARLDAQQKVLDAQQKTLDAQQKMLEDLKSEIEALKATRH